MDKSIGKLGSWYDVEAKKRGYDVPGYTGGSLERLAKREEEKFKERQAFQDRDIDRQKSEFALRSAGLKLAEQGINFDQMMEDQQQLNDPNSGLAEILRNQVKELFYKDDELPEGLNNATPRQLMQIVPSLPEIAKSRLVGTTGARRRDQIKSGAYEDESGNLIHAQLKYIWNPEINDWEVFHGQKNISDKEIFTSYAPTSKIDPLTKDISVLERTRTGRREDELRGVQRPGLPSADLRTSRTTEAEAPDRREQQEFKILDSGIKLKEEEKLLGFPLPTTPIGQVDVSFHPEIRNKQNQIRQINEKFTQQMLEQEAAATSGGMYDIRRRDIKVKALEKQRDAELAKEMKELDEMEKDVRKRLEEVRKLQGDSLSLYRNLADIGNLKDEVNTGFIMDPMRSVGQYFDLTGPLSNELKVQIGKATAEYIKSISGLAVTDAERKWLLTTIPQTKDDDKLFKDKLRAFVRGVEHTRRSKLVNSGLFEPSEDVLREHDDTIATLERISRGSPSRGAVLGPSFAPSKRGAVPMSQPKSDRVRVRNAKGQIGSIPRNELEKALSEGYEVVE